VVIKVFLMVEKEYFVTPKKLYDSNFSVHKQSFIGTQPLFYVSIAVASVLPRQT
jgi:hypothetical protein